ncbi:DUF503 domain-containing protein [Clostridium polynesiense]|uniref:DUF503 domain-containing protein n=1 Tax=Clostridium polynesiense TaxID=1325933 RepID=UPI00058B3434|nr:DUF503 domain-containing protein [Clostridium polynesiense]
MIIGTLKIHLMVPWSHSLKEKRMVVKSIIDKIRHKFNVSIAEVEDQDLHQSIILGVCCVTNESSHANSVLQKVIDYINNNCEAEIIDTLMEIL